MKNSEIVKILEDIADLLELKGENIFKSRAYQKAARSIEFLSEDVEKLVAENRLREIPGVGEAIAKKLAELVTTGHLEYYDKLRSEFPEGIGTFLDVPGIGPRTAYLLTKELKVATGKLEKFETEQAFYQRQGLGYIPPEIREGQYEIELAEKGALPRLVELSEIKGDLHVHTDWSDGQASIENMIQAAQERGYRYMAITDHSIGLGIARGLDIERIHQQIRDIQELKIKYPGFSLFTGLEVDIKANGTLDIPDEILGELDIVLASVHSSLNQSGEQMTQRIMRAIENPHVDIIAHPTCRLLGEREPVEIYLETVFKAAIRHNTALEINAMPSRLDLKDTHIYQARQMGVKLVINTDAHQPEHLDYMRFGVGTARRGWCEARDILNTLPLDELLTFLKR